MKIGQLFSGRRAVYETADARASTVVNGWSVTDTSQYAWLVPRNEFQTYRTNPLRSGQIRMPAQFVADLSLNKPVQITERLRVQFRAEAFNALNRFNIFPVRYNTNPPSGAGRLIGDDARFAAAVGAVGVEGILVGAWAGLNDGGCG